MPRLSHSLLLQARNISPLLPLLLRACRTLNSARNELRWLREHAVKAVGTEHDQATGVRAFLLQLCLRRSRGIPLQYLLGSQPFGDLDILCRPGVLIPRPETEAYTYHIPKLVTQGDCHVRQDEFRILDICTGTSCISLLLYSLLSQKYPDMQVMGVDISDAALTLARDNIKHNVMHGHLSERAMDQVSFLKADILSESFQLRQLSQDYMKWDIVISNPPYISEIGFSTDTNRSVRSWEPKLALVPPHPHGEDLKSSPAEDIFYYRILEIAKAGHAGIVLMEVGDLQQALRVAQIALSTGIWSVVEIWRDWPDQISEDLNEVDEAVVYPQRIRIRGSGHGRSVLCKRSKATKT